VRSLLDHFEEPLGSAHVRHRGRLGAVTRLRVDGVRIGGTGLVPRSLVAAEPRELSAEPVKESTLGDLGLCAVISWSCVAHTVESRASEWWPPHIFATTRGAYKAAPA
jgi:hypothetical protein